ncbi:MAG: 3-oxoacyl-ACP reductase FabG [Desulfobulbaceae bacterium]|jgi:3-oxoacyl-[acyl-carrier protein] reductase|nr:3-oxoacyl-ACP reductase FabG [Desulfobulbaceae bacterium]
MKEKQQTALITGASGGIGRAICLELAKAGHYIGVHYFHGREAAGETLRLVRESGGDGELIQFDVRDGQAAESAIWQFADQHGDIDMLVNNAGVIADGLFMLMPPENWRKVIDTSLDGFYNVTRPVIEKMARAKRGAVLSISSASALIGGRGQANYAAAKAGLNAASRSLACEVARLGIRVNVVAPGLIETEMIAKAPKEEIRRLIPMARLGKAEEVAKVVAFLLSDDASYITGQVISVNGGLV